MSVLVDFRKWPDTTHWQFTMQPLGKDEHGVWLWAPPGMEFWLGDKPAKHTSRVAVKLITNDTWWSAIWPGGHGVEVYVDIATPARWSEDTVTMIDLDLDLIRHSDGTVQLVDEDEFAEHSIALSYPPHLIANARSTAAQVYLDLESNTEPFGSAAAHWMTQALAANGAS